MLTPELATRIARLKVADLADGCRRLGFRGAVAGPALRPAVPYARLCGTALTVRLSVAPGTFPYNEQMAGLYDLGRSAFRGVLVQRNEVPGFTSMGSGGARVLRAHGYVGCVADGPLRDTEELREESLPVFGTAVRPDSILVDEVPPGHAIRLDVGVRVEVAGMQVSPGDVLVGDNDGVIALPADRLAQVVAEAEGIIALEQRIFAQLDRGMTFGEILQSDPTVAGVGERPS
jgi:regulator of RNase E activity RraA